MYNLQDVFEKMQVILQGWSVGKQVASGMVVFHGYREPRTSGSPDLVRLSFCGKVKHVKKSLGICETDSRQYVA